jgi:hypothetical protein
MTPEGGGGAGTPGVVGLTCTTPWDPTCGDGAIHGADADGGGSLAGSLRVVGGASPWQATEKANSKTTAAPAKCPRARDRASTWFTRPSSRDVGDAKAAPRRKGSLVASASSPTVGRSRSAMCAVKRRVAAPLGDSPR